MDDLITLFTTAHTQGAGYAIASTIDPAGPSTHPYLVYDFARSSTPSKVETDLRYATVYNNALSLSKTEARTWQDVYVAYWKFAQEYSSTEPGLAASTSNGAYVNNGRNKAQPTQEGQYARIYDAWKDVVNALIRGYSSSALQVWTLPCLYVAGKYLRTFAIKADEQAARTKGNVTFNVGLQDDIVGSFGKNEKLEDAARQINRIFSLCISDRYVRVRRAVKRREGKWWQQTGKMADQVTGHQLRSQGSGRYTTSSTCSSRRTSR